MAPHLLDFKTAVVTGGGGGLGYAMAEWLLKKKGKKVILVGRTESNLKEAVQKLGGETTYYVLDTGKIEDIKPFVDRLIKENPDVDCLINNAGVQRPLEVTNLDLEKLDQEINIVSSATEHDFEVVSKLTIPPLFFFDDRRISAVPSIWRTLFSSTSPRSLTPW